MVGGTAGTTVSRRAFLRRSAMAAAAGVGFPTLIPASALGLGTRAPPSERIGMGFIGLGGQGSGHLFGGAWTYVPGGFMARRDVQVLALCDVRQERREQALQRCRELRAGAAADHALALPAAVNDFREVLARPDIDAVLLALPYHWHAPMATLAARAGKDVYSEKPVCITVQEGRELASAFRRLGRTFQAGTQQRSEYDGKFRLACDVVRSGRLGELREVYAYRSPGAFVPSRWTDERSTPVPAGFDWDLWLGPLPWRPYNGEAGHALSGLFVGDVNWAPHHYDFVQWVVNADPGQPVTVWPEAGAIHYRYHNGVVVHSGAFPGEPVGGEGGACLVGSEGRLAVDRSRLVAYPETVLRAPFRPGEPRLPRITSHVGNFLDCVRTRATPLCDPPTALRSMTSVLVGGIALALGRELTWDPSTEGFVGDAEANRLLAYTPRPPWSA